MGSTRGISLVHRHPFFVVAQIDPTLLNHLLQQVFCILAMILDTGLCVDIGPLTASHVIHRSPLKRAPW